MLAGISGDGEVPRAARDARGNEVANDSNATMVVWCVLSASACLIDAWRASSASTMSGSLWSRR